MGKRGKDINKLIAVMDMILNEQPLPPEHENHPLHGDLEGFDECHIQGDWVLIYKINKDDRSVRFHRTGSHSDLF